MIVAGSNVICDFTLHAPESPFGPADADSTPEAVLVRNGVDTDEDVDVTRKELGVYTIDFDVPTDWSISDVVQVRVSATVDGVTDKSNVFTVTLSALSATSGIGTVSVWHNYGGTDALRVVDSLNAGIDDVTISAYLRSQWDAGNRSDHYVVGRTVTNVNGRWTQPMMLDPEEYVLTFVKQGQYLSEELNLTVA